MIPAPFEYIRAGSIFEAADLLRKHGDDAKLLAGGHSLIPAMKLRLAEPMVLIDIGRIADLKGIREEDGKIIVGAMTTHAEIEASDLLRRACPLLPEVARTIGDAQVRNRGTLGGSLAHADPAGDWPAAALALEAELEISGPDGGRWVRARDFFVDILQTLLKPDDILKAIHFPVTDGRVAYRKFAQQASGFALAGAAARVKEKGVVIGVTGVAPVPYRAVEVEKALAGGTPDGDRIREAAALAAEGVEPLGDIHASPDYRAHLARVMTERALLSAVSR